MAKRNRTERSTLGVRPRTFPRSVQWKVDQDYIAKLSPAEKAWLSEFNNHFYAADFRDDPDEWSAEERRATYTDKNTANSDVYSKAKANALVSPLDEHLDLTETGRDYSPSPAYLASPEYQEALARFREHLSKSRRLDPPEKTQQYEKDKFVLEQIVNGKNKQDS